LIKAAISLAVSLAGIQLTRTKYIVFRLSIGHQRSNIPEKVLSPEAGERMPNITTFNTGAPYIYLSIFVAATNGALNKFDAILDTGAPRTEFSDEALRYAGFLSETKSVDLKPGLQTQKYSKLLLPHLQICGHSIENLEIFVSHFEKSWGIDALVGLDFLRRFKVQIDYSKGIITSEEFQPGS
jgi:predicted aspartyl protease